MHTRYIVRRGEVTIRDSHL